MRAERPEELLAGSRVDGVMTNVTQQRRALVLAGGGARGAYEAGVLSYVFEHIYPRLPRGFEFDIFSGTSVGAVHAAFSAATTNADPGLRAKQLLETWRTMRLREVLHLGVSDLLAIPLRALGLGHARGSARGNSVLGGLVDVAPLEQIVEARIPWSRLPEALRRSTPKALCVSCTEVRTGRVTVFMDGPLADSRPWSHDPNAQAIETRIDARHVRASASIPFLFPAVRVEDLYYVDGGLRMNTPLSPALRLSADRILVVARGARRKRDGGATRRHEQAVTQPAFLLGKVLDALTLDPLDFLTRINPAVREQRGTGYRRVETAVLRPSQDLGVLAAECHRRSGGTRELGLVSALLTQATRRGIPEEEADLLSYLLFDRCYTEPLLELGRADASARVDEIVKLLTSDEGETS